MENTHKNDEFLDLVNENDEIIGEVWKSEAHGDPSKIHREVVIAVFSTHGEVLIQRRSIKKKINPGKWEITAAGHVNKGEDPEDAIKREVEEELGLKVKPVFFRKLLVKNNKHNESKFYWIYYAVVNDGSKVTIDSDEVMDARWIKPDKLGEFSEENNWDTSSHSHSIIIEIALMIQIKRIGQLRAKYKRLL